MSPYPVLDILSAVFTVYYITIVLTVGHIAKDLRQWIHDFRRHWGVEFAFETCRLCVGFWVSLAVWLVMMLTLPVHFGLFDLGGICGAAYFLACLERPKGQS